MTKVAYPCHYSSTGIAKSRVEFDQSLSCTCKPMRLSDRQKFVLRLIHEGKNPRSELSHVSQTISSLVERQLIEIRDGRFVLTDAGQMAIRVNSG